MMPITVIYNDDDDDDDDEQIDDNGYYILETREIPIRSFSNSANLFSG